MTDGIPRDLPAAMRAELPSLTDEIITAIRRKIPEYARPNDGLYGKALRAGVSLSLKTFVDQVADPSAPTEERDATCRLLGEFEAKAGRSLEDLHSAYRTGCQVAWRRLIKVLLKAEVPAEAIAGLADALMSYADELVRLSADGYRKANGASALARRQVRTRLAREILAQPSAPREVLQKLADQARWPLPETVTAIALRFPAGTAADLAQDDAPLADSSLLADLDGPDPYLLIPGDFTPPLQSMLDATLPRCRLAAGLAVPLDRAASSLRWARRLGEVADDGLIESARDLRCEDHLIELWLLADQDLADAIVRQYAALINRVPAQERAWLVSTFEPWLRPNSTISDIADSLGVHGQTVRYRLARLKEIFGEIIDNPDSRLALELTLRVLRLRWDANARRKQGE